MQDGEHKPPQWWHGIQAKGRCLRVIAPVSVDDHLAAFAKSFPNQPVQFFHSRCIRIGAVKPIYKFVEV